MTDWKLLPHGGLEPLTENLWTVTGELPHMAMRRRMCVARMDDGGLVIHSAINLDDEQLRRLLAWGEPRHLVVPGAFHRMDAAAWKTRFPELRVWCPRGARGPVSKVVGIDGHYAEFPNDASIALLPLDGTANREGVMQVHTGEEVSLVFNDVLFNQPHVGGGMGLMMRLMGSTGSARITPLSRVFLVDDRAELRADLQSLAEKEGLVRIVPGHGAVIDEDVRETLLGIADKL